MFEEQFRLGTEENSQLCIYVKGVKVVDLWGSTNVNSKFDGDSLTTVMSSAKSLTSILMAMAVDRGWLDYKDKICKHWPDFAQHGKGNVKVADLMRHESGLAHASLPLNVTVLTREHIKQNK